VSLDSVESRIIARFGPDSREIRSTWVFTRLRVELCVLFIAVPDGVSTVLKGVGRIGQLAAVCALTTASLLALIGYQTKDPSRAFFNRNGCFTAAK